MTAITDDAHRADAAKVRSLLAKYNDTELLVQIGEYKEGRDALADAGGAALQWGSPATGANAQD